MKILRKGEHAIMKDDIEDMAVLYGSVEMGKLRYKEWVYNVPKIATSAESWFGTVLIPKHKRSTPHFLTPCGERDNGISLTPKKTSYVFPMIMERPIGNDKSVMAIAMTLNYWVHYFLNFLLLLLLVQVHSNRANEGDAKVVCIICIVYSMVF